MFNFLIHGESEKNSFLLAESENYSYTVQINSHISVRGLINEFIISYPH